MNQHTISTQHTRPGRVIHLSLTAGILVYGLIVEILENQLAPFDGFSPEIGSVLKILRICLAVVGIADLAIALNLPRMPHLVGSAGAAFVIAYACLDALAVFGLVLFLVAGHRLDFYGFAIPALVGQLLLWAQAGQWDELVMLEQHDPNTPGEWYG